MTSKDSKATPAKSADRTGRATQRESPTGKRGQEERDASAVRVAKLHSPRQR